MQHLNDTYVFFIYIYLYTLLLQHNNLFCG